MRAFLEARCENWYVEERKLQLGAHGIKYREVIKRQNAGKAERAPASSAAALGSIASVLKSPLNVEVRQASPAVQQRGRRNID